MGGMGGNLFSYLNFVEFLILPGVSDTQKVLLALIKQVTPIQEFLKSLALSCGSSFMGLGFFLEGVGGFFSKSDKQL